MHLPPPVEPSEGVLAETTDPDGRTVVLDDKGWEHILHQHP
ncbi:MAG TPA: hypothetical protein VGI76_11115 [Solirubrobacteraceae bacterium]